MYIVNALSTTVEKLCGSISGTGLQIAGSLFTLLFFLCVFHSIILFIDLF